MKMSSLHRVEGLSVFGDGPAPGMARRGPWNSAVRGRGHPWWSGARWILLSRRRGGAVGGIRSGMGTFGRAVALCARGAAGLEDEVAGRRLRGEDHALIQDDGQCERIGQPMCPRSWRLSLRFVGAYLWAANRRGRDLTHIGWSSPLQMRWTPPLKVESIQTIVIERQ